MSDAAPVPARWHDADDLRWAARHWAARMEVRLREVHIRPMTTKWASMSTAGRLTLNSELLDLPRAAGEYVIVHELVHLLAPNPGRCSGASCPRTCRTGKSGRHYWTRHWLTKRVRHDIREEH